MFANSVAALMIASLLTAQTPVPDANAAPAAMQNTPSAGAQNTEGAAGQNLAAPAGQNSPAPAAQDRAPAAAQTITLPGGTAIPVTLMSVIKSKSTKPGDSIRAVVAFPVTQGTQVAIPAGTYAEGVVNQVKAKPWSNQQPTIRAHFTRLVFANGYSVALSGENSQALLLPTDTSTPANEVAELMPVRLPGEHFAMGAGQTMPPTPTLPPLPQVGPNPAVVVGVGSAAFAGLLIATFAWMHHRADTYDFAVFDVGWQFEIVLDDPVTLDMTQVMAAAMAPPSVN
jgi:hypothetical protein